MANSKTGVQKKRTLPTLSGESPSLSSLLSDTTALATDREDGIRHRENTDGSQNHIMGGNSMKRQRISDEESTNEEACEASFQDERDESVKSDEGNVITREEQTMSTETNKMPYKVPITPERKSPMTIGSSPSKHPKQLGVGVCVETAKNNTNAAAAPKSGRIGTRSTTSSRPRKIWSKAKSTPKYEEKSESHTVPCPKRPPTKTTGDDENCWYYFCQFCHHRFPFPKDEDLPPLDEHFNVSDNVPWGDLRFHQRIQTVRRHMRNKHQDVPESTWPAGYAKVSRSLNAGDNDDYVEVDSSDKSSNITLAKGMADKEYKYTCFIKGCGHVFHTKGWEPPLNDRREISDDKRWNSGTLITSVRCHMRLEHPDIDEHEWPCGFAANDGANSRLAAVEAGDGEERETDDAEIDKHRQLCGLVSAISEEAGPAVEAADGKAPETAGGTVTDRLRTITSGDCFKYHCPVPGCAKVFRIPMHLYPPLDCSGNVTDYYPWPPQLDYIRQWVHFHIRKDHADYMTSFVTPESETYDTGKCEKGGGGDFMKGDATYEGELGVNDKESDVSSGEYRAECNQCWCSYQQCWHRS
eukprot:scaffold34630_cov185-Amphora_coffeaeformis.AAC.3